jgi:hypothetical protein
MPQDFGIDEDLGVLDVRALRVFGIFWFLEVDDEEADRLADLHGGEADPRRVVHRLEHVGDERLQIVVERLDGLRNLPEDRIGRLIDAAYGHKMDLVFQLNRFKKWADVPAAPGQGFLHRDSRVHRRQEDRVPTG